MTCKRSIKQHRFPAWVVVAIRHDTARILPGTYSQTTANGVRNSLARQQRLGDTTRYEVRRIE